MKMKLMFVSTIALAMTLGGSVAMAQSAPQAAVTPSAPAAPPPLPLSNVGPPSKLQFPPASPKDFTASSPTTQDVNTFLKRLWGYDANRVWKVMAIEKTEAPNVSQVVVLVGEQGVSHTPSPTVFFVTPDGQHAIAGTAVVPFGPHPFSVARQKLELQANGPYRGSSSKDLMLVEFADLQCPECKAAAGTMDKLVQDFPKARVVLQLFPLTAIHHEAEKAAEYAVCVAQQKGNAAFFQFAQAVYDTQANLTSDADGTLKAAATKAGADATAVSNCAATPAAASAVAASVKLGQELNVNQTPTLFVNGRPVPVTGIPYNTLKQIVSFDEAEVSAPAASTGE